MTLVKQKDLVKISDYIWEIPQIRKDMKTPARIFASAEMIRELFKDKSLWQLINLTTLPGIYKYSLAMPDVHEGYGSPVGGVAAFVVDEGIVSPGICGYDINCGVRLLISSLSYSEIKSRIPRLIKEIFQEVPSGVGRGGFWKLTKEEMEQILFKGAKFLLEKGYAQINDIETTENYGCFSDIDYDSVSKSAKERGRDQLGTIGAGNHFVEVQRISAIYDESIAKHLGLFNDQVCVLIHCGSRGLGHQVATDYIQRALHYLEKQNIHLVDRELAYFPLETTLATDYISAMKASANFAFANRQLITYEVRKAFTNIFGANVRLKQIYDLAHNIIKFEKYNGIDLIVHRKGATRAFWKNHPDLPKQYKNLGQPVLIPGSMGTSSYILLGQEIAGNISFGSAPHGAGRVMSRNEAKRKIRGRELKNELEEREIFVEAGSMSGLAEEAPLAYKDINQVVEVICNIGIAKKLARLVPVGVIKG